ncbi:MAG: hypothetical protein ACKVU0_03745 [Saprospiraceae bacterium]
MKSMTLPLLCLLFAACTPHAPKPLELAFFCWETTLDLTPDAHELLDSLGCKKLYVKVLDVGKNAASGEIEPYSRTVITDTAELAGLEIIPTVFITNEVFQNISTEKMEWLAGKIAEASNQPYRKALLLDCDWTPSTREAFFLFLKKMRGKLPPGASLEATIRLHQYKFPKKTGVPPVDRGMLMFYNTGDVDEEGERNTVFHPDDALKYLDGAPKKYPLPLDLALPLFSWGLIFREGELWKIVPGPLPLDEMRRSEKYQEIPPVEPFSAQLWELKEGTFLGGHYLRPGDHLRVSAISPELLFKVASLARKLDLADDANLAFFHLGIAKSEHFSAQQLDSVCHSVR